MKIEVDLDELNTRLEAAYKRGYDAGRKQTHRQRRNDRWYAARENIERLADDLHLLTAYRPWK